MILKQKRFIVLMHKLICTKVSLALRAIYRELKLNLDAKKENIPHFSVSRFGFVNVGFVYY